MAVHYKGGSGTLNDFLVALFLIEKLSQLFCDIFMKRHQGLRRSITVKVEMECMEYHSVRCEVLLLND